jgi:predicted phosphodiesterase
MRFGKTICLMLACSAIATPTFAQEWVFEPGYDLPRKAAVRAALPTMPAAIGAAPEAASLFFGQTATESRILADKAPHADLTLEMLVLDHVNQPVGALLSVGEARLGYYSRQAVFGAATKLQTKALERRGHKGFWRHLVATRAGNTWTLYVNGVLTETVRAGASARSSDPVRLDAYLAAEPFMRLENLVQVVAVEPEALTSSQVTARFQERAQRIQEGRLFSDRLHFTQPPYLNTPSQTSMELSFEFDRAVTAKVEVGLTEATLQPVPLAGNATRSWGLTLPGLSADTPYFYRVTGTDEAGQTLNSGLLSFRTAPPPGRPFTFVAMADTEARAHINNAVSQLMWQERPNLMLIAGDLTDGGGTEHRFEWTHEYFQGMGPIFGRVPTIAALGNGEQELDWYRHYHRHPEPENYFSVVYGDVEFFVLDSYLGYRERRDPGFRARQRAWLEGALRASTARWKIALHHHDVRTSDDDDHGNTYRETSTHVNDEVQADFVPLYERYGVDLVFFGHLHAYERSWPIRGDKVDEARGVTYLQIGGAGGNLEDFAPNKPWFSRMTFRDHHYAAVSVSKDAIEVRVVDVNGRLRDQFRIARADRADGGATKK